MRRALDMAKVLRALAENEPDAGTGPRRGYVMAPRASLRLAADELERLARQEAAAGVRYFDVTYRLDGEEETRRRVVTATFDLAAEADALEDVLAAMLVERHSGKVADDIVALLVKELDPVAEVEKRDPAARPHSVTVELNDEEQAALYDMADRTGMSVEQVVRHSVRVYQLTLEPLNLGDEDLADPG